MCEECEADPWYPTIQEFLKRFPMAEWGPAHVVFSDFNTDAPCVKDCLHDAEMMKAFIENRFNPNEKYLDESSYAYQLHFEIKDALDELNGTIELLDRMLKESPPIE